MNIFSRSLDRDLRIDSLKSVMIFLVVLGHIGGYDPDIRKVIYSFHMPVFVFISGYLTSPDTDRKKQVSWFRNTFLIYLCAQTAHYLLSLVITSGASALTYITTPAPILWYLVSLIFWRFFIWRIFSKVDIWLVIVPLLLALACGIVPLDRELSFQRTFAFFPFFTLGVFFRAMNLMERLERFPLWAALGLLAMGLYIAYLLPWSYQPKIRYAGWNDVLIRIIQTMLGLLLCLSIVRLSRQNKRGFLSKYGKYTLWIYVGHSFLNNMNSYLESAVKCLIPRFEMNIIMSILLAFVYCTICIVAARLLRKIRSGL